uniref:Arrestin_C domain-containing protein n=1 Tax=Panagrellus redivivus TaxID=6233 RepID=A0A7E4VX75_PANRE
MMNTNHFNPRTTNLNIPQAKPMPKPYDIYVEFHERIYKPGDTVTGNVHLSLRKKLACDIVQVQLYGEAKVVITKTAMSNTPGSLTRNTSSSQWHRILDEYETLWQSPYVNDPKTFVSTDELVRMSRSTTINTRKLAKPTHFPGIEAGEYDYPFKFELPASGLATSFQAKHSGCSIKYSVTAMALNNGSSVLRKKELFPIVIDRPLDLVPNAFMPVDIHGKANISGHEIIAKLSLHKRGYTPGEPLSGTVEIINNSKKSVKYCCATIVQKITAYTNLPHVEISKTVNEIASTAMPMHKITANTQYKYELDYHIPALTPDFEIDSCLSVSYELKLTVGLERKHPYQVVITLSAPLTIGTSTSGLEGVDPSAPPDFDSNYLFTDAPPSYDYAVGSGSRFDSAPDYDLDEKKAL